MKKIILLSIITSGMLLASTITNLTTDTKNTMGGVANAPSIINSDVTQGHTIVTGDSTISGLDINQNVGVNGGNDISSTSLLNSKVNQGLTHVNKGTVTNSGLKSTNTMTNDVVVDASIDQATTIVNDDAKLIGTEVSSENTISGTNIISAINDSNVSQSTLELNNEALLVNSKLDTTNTIDSATIIASQVHQARVRIGGDYTVASLDMTEVNNLTANLVNSSVIQGGLDVCDHDADASGWCED